MMVAVIITVVFLMTGLAFRSILIPLRLLLTVAVTLVFVAGTTQVVFQQAMGLDGVYWLIPIATAPLVVGLTIDYDVFLISRVHETRLKGRSTSKRGEEQRRGAEKRSREEEQRRAGEKRSREEQERRGAEKSRREKE